MQQISLRELEPLKTHISKFVGISDSEFDEIFTYFTRSNFSKKQNLLVEGDICKSNYFVAKGCIRLFFINEKGVEQTIQFALENWWLSDFTSFSRQSASEFYIQTVEDSDIIAIDLLAQEEMLQKFPEMERYFRFVHQRAHAAYQFRLKILYGVSREELYRLFVSKYPEFVQRIPQYLLASFLGFTPEYLSELRRKKIS